MPKLATPLTDAKVKTAKPKEKTYTLGDGDGMYLEITPNGSKVWRLQYRQANGKSNRLTFGPYPEVSLLEARTKRLEARKLLVAGIDPAEHRRNEKQAKAIATSNDFESVANAWFAKFSPEMAPSTKKRTLSWLNKDIIPYLGRMPVSTIKPIDVLTAVRRIEERGAIDSSHRAKQVCSHIFRYAIALGLVEQDVTIQLRGNLPTVKHKHYASITDPKQVAELLRAIHGYSGHPTSMAALKLLPLVFVRPGELRAAEWAEFDLDAAEWRIPAEKMKMKVEHLVPLSKQAVAILREMQVLTGRGKYVFPSVRTGERCMSDNTLNAALRRMGYDKSEMTAHGFRAMARTILDEVLHERVDFIEHQLAHAVKDPNGRAYNRTAHLPARKEMMQRWADYLDMLRMNKNVISANFGTAA